MKVYLNTVEMGEYIFILGPEDTVFFPMRDLLDMGFDRPPEDAEVEIEGERYILLNKIQGVGVEIDKERVILHITAEPHLLKKHLFDLSFKGPKDVLYVRNDSAFLNYYLDYLTGDVDFGSLSLSLETGVNIGGYFGHSNFSYLNSNSEDRFVRLMTSITKDDPVTLRRYVLGDSFATSGLYLSGGLILGGVGISKNYKINPYFIKVPSLTLSGAVQTPSDIEIYVDDYLIRRERVPPGEFEFLNLIERPGAGISTILIKDAYGRVKKVDTPFYISSSLLRPGVQEYSYTLGFKREDFGKESFRYTEPLLIGFHRLGLTDTLTVGAGIEGGREGFNLSPSITFLLGLAGEMHISGAISNHNGQIGYGALLGYSYTSRKKSLRISVRGFSRGYSNVSLLPSQDKPWFEGNINSGYNLGRLGTISVGFSMGDYYASTEVKRFSINYTKRLRKDLSFHLRFTRTETDEVVNKVFIGLRISLGGHHSGEAKYTSDGEVSEQTLLIYKDPPFKKGIGYRLNIERVASETENGEVNGDVLIHYRFPAAISRINYRHISGEDVYNLGVTGGIVFIKDSLFLTRPITDSFVLVRVDGLEGVRVYYSNKEVGRTNRKGDLIVPYILSYHPNNISIEPEDIPVQYELKAVKKYVTTPYRGGGIMEFETRALQGFIGHLFMLQKGRKEPAEYGRLEIKAEDSVIKTVTGKGGEFYLENLPPGKFPARLFLKDMECDFELTIPHSNKVIVNIGEVICHMN